MTSALLTAIASAFYIIAAVCYSATLLFDSPSAPILSSNNEGNSRPARFAPILIIFGLICLVAATGVNCVRTAHSPFASSYGTLVVAAWLISAIFLYLDRKTHSPALGAAIMAVVCAILGFAYGHAHSHVSSDPILGDQIVTVHVLAIIAAYGLILTACGCATLYLVQDRLLKSHSTRHVPGRMPPLTRLDSIAFQCIAYAVPLITLALGIGVTLVYSGATKLKPGAWFTDPHFVSTTVLWSLLSAYLIARLAAGWRGVRLQYILLFGILCAFAAYALPITSAHHFN